MKKDRGVNIGNWSELYTFLKLLADGKIHAANRDLSANKELYYIILKIIRNELDKNKEFIRDKKIVIKDSDGKILSEIPISIFVQYSELLLKRIQNREEKSRSFEIKEAIEMLDKLGLKKISEGSSKKSDIIVVIHDPITQAKPQITFSIKSFLGSKPTLFNASKATNITFNIKPDLTKTHFEEISVFEKYSERINWLKENNYQLIYCKMANNVFSSNLQLIDSKLDTILAEIVKISYFKGINKLNQLILELNNINPCNFDLDLNSRFYEYKIKRFLVDASLGLTASNKWSGDYDVTGGFIIVKKSGELVCFHIYNWNDYQDYLLSNTKIDRPDSKPNRCNFGTIMIDKINEFDRTYKCSIDLNFQIRYR